LELSVNQDGSSATRAQHPEVTIEAEEERVGGGRKSAMKQAQDKMKSANSGPKVSVEHTFSEEDFR